MTTHTLLLHVYARGVRMTPMPDGTIHVRARKGVLTSMVIAAMREHKAEFFGLVMDYEERAAIAEYCGGLPREQAEQLAWMCLADVVMPVDERKSA